MKKQSILIACMLIFSSILLKLHAQGAAGKTLTKKEAEKWFKEGKWKQGVELKPHESIDHLEFARQYQANKDYWDKAFRFLNEHDLKTIAKGKYPIDGENVFATVTEDPTKDFEKTNWESHRKYVDLQCIISGDEKMGVWPVADATVTKPYDEQKDVANYTADGKFYTDNTGSFFIFFPKDAHRPGITPGSNLPVKKIVIKVRAMALE
jgi:YhcH/YjgK/YiaL family protein